MSAPNRTANKAAEEGELSDEEIFTIYRELDGEAWNKGHEQPDTLELARKIIAADRASRQDNATSILRDMLAIQEACNLHTDEYAPGSVIEHIKELEADRASRQVANKAEVERDAARYRWLRDPDTDVALVLDKRTGFVPPDESVPGVGGYSTYEYRAGEELDTAIDAAMGIATPPATTGASTTCYGASKAEQACPCAECKAEVSASTVLTDAQITEIAYQAYLSGRLPSWSGFKKDGDGKYNIPVLTKLHCDLVREVAAQAGQVAVPEGWKLVPVEPTSEMMDAAEACSDDWPRTTWVKAYRAMLAAAPSAPAVAQRVPEDVARDAARYRWLRGPATDIANVIDKEFGPGMWEYKAGEELDTAIDEAMQAPSPAKESK